VALLLIAEYRSARWLSAQQRPWPDARAKAKLPRPGKTGLGGAPGGQPLQKLRNSGAGHQKHRVDDFLAKHGTKTKEAAPVKRTEPATKTTPASTYSIDNCLNA
jgi:hypothetical protein